MRMTLKEVSRCCRGALSPSSSAAVVADGAAIDSRRLRPQQVFIALPGALRDGHDYLPQAAAVGAAAAVVTKESDINLPQIIVDDAQEALTNWAAAGRDAFPGNTIAITGSNGKTTVKEMLVEIFCAYMGEDAVHNSAGNFNNTLGVPLTMLGLQEPHKILIAETGMDAAGELTQLSALLRPQVAVINNAQRAHMGNFASLRDIALAKGELLSGLTADGVAVLNADDKHFPLWKKLAGKKKIVSFGLSQKATICGVIDEDCLQVGEMIICLQVAGRHNRLNALAAIAAALALEVPTAAIINGLQNFRSVAGRLQQTTLVNGCVLIDDTYNANPDSAAAALAVLQEVAAPLPALLIMGEMAALGAGSKKAHKTLVRACQRANIRLFAYGEAFRDVVQGDGNQYFADKATLIQAVRAWMQKEKLCILVKGSRSTKMEEVVIALREDDAL